VRSAVRRHLARFPFAGDTREGIVASWLPVSGYDDARAFIDEVLAEMVRHGELEQQPLPDGAMLYVRGPRCSED
jgi:hypothetical protein